jgi:hypothetical protein
MNDTEIQAAIQIQNNLLQYDGSENLYARKCFGSNIQYTDGIKYLIESCECNWLIDAIASYQSKAFKAFDYMQFWTLTVATKDNSATLICDDGNESVRVTQEIPYTEFPLPSIKIYASVEDDTTVRLYLPTEH